MSHFGIKVLKTVFVLSLISGGVVYAANNAAHVNARSALQTVEVKSDAAANWVGGKTDVVRKKVQRLDIDRKIDTFQDKAHPLGQKITSTVGPKITPVFRAVEQGERRMSWPALLLILVFGSVFVLFGISGPTSRLGGRH